MGKIFKEDFILNNQGNIDWNKSVGVEFRFIYKELQYSATVKQKLEGGYILLSYNNNDFKIHGSAICRCCFGEMVGNINHEYMFKIGDMVNSLKVISQTRLIKNKSKEKAYKVRCEECGFGYETSESDLKKSKVCRCCSGKVAVIGINTVYDKRKDLVSYFINEEDSKGVTCGSSKRVNLTCPICNSSKQMSVDKLTSRGFSCPLCGDRSSYSEKFMYVLLNKLGYKFEKEKTFNWNPKKRYDFYIEELNLIVECHGLQHYEETNFTKISLTKQQSIDKEKEELAIRNGIKNYIQLDCRISEHGFIKNSILNSKLIDIINICDYNLDEIDFTIYNNTLKSIWDLWNEGIRSTTEIGKITNISRSTVLSRIKLGEKLGIIENAMMELNKETRRKINSKIKSPIVCCETKCEYDSISSCIKDFEEKGIMLKSSSMSRALKDGTKYRGYTFKYLKE